VRVVRKFCHKAILFEKCFHLKIDNFMDISTKIHDIKLKFLKSVTSFTFLSAQIYHNKSVNFPKKVAAIFFRHFIF
jgi:hypothetical protein